MAPTVNNAGSEAGKATVASSSERPAKAAAKTAANSSFGANMPKMSSAFDTAYWLSAA